MPNNQIYLNAPVAQGGPPPLPRHQKGSFTEFLKGQVNGANSYVKSYDIFGQPVSLNYQGQATYKTCPGGMISMVIKTMLFFYIILKLKYLIFKEEWKLKQQTVVADLEELTFVHELGQE
mmetsp:Transcript_11629/g.17646  ORF Transcript_11629/g.17646 Transcript_11629/m.17646 type:complete len:120 (+) Transcript_11629:45-404(+)